MAQLEISTTYNQQCNTAHPKQHVFFFPALSLSGGKGLRWWRLLLCLEPLEDTRSSEPDRTQPVFHAQIESGVSRHQVTYENPKSTLRSSQEKPPREDRPEAACLPDYIPAGKQ